MLVLTRKQAETIVFPSLGISVSVVRISGNSVRLGIEAPSDISVRRQEVAEQMMRESGRVDDAIHPVSATA